MRDVRIAAIAVAWLTLAGCGSSTTDKTAAFIGPWTITSGSVSGACPAPFGMVNQTLDGAVQTIAKGTDSDLVLTLLPGCTVKMDVTGSIATFRTTPPQTCMLTFTVMNLPVMPTATFTAGSFTVNGNSASFSITGTAMASVLSCGLTGSGTLTKAAPADGGSDGSATAADAIAADAASADSAAADDAATAD